MGSLDSVGQGSSLFPAVREQNELPFVAWFTWDEVEQLLRKELCQLREACPETAEW